jgi:hypothetical protein
MNSSSCVKFRGNMKVLCKDCLRTFDDEWDVAYYIADGRFICEQCYLYDKTLRELHGIQPLKMGFKGGKQSGY